MIKFVLESDKTYSIYANKLNDKKAKEKVLIGYLGINGYIHKWCFQPATHLHFSMETLQKIADKLKELNNE